jgi:hypothetical protein
MLEATIKRLRHDKRAVSNVIVIMLSLVLIVIIVSNIVLWSYQMNQFDLERMQENVNITNVTRVTHSPWYTSQNEYVISAGRILSGTYSDTTILDGASETFREENAQIFNPSSYVLGSSTRQVAGSLLSLTSNDAGYMSFRSYPNYEVEYQESLGVNSTTSTSYQSKVSLNFTPQLTADFVIIAVAEVQGSNTNYQAKAQLAVDSTVYQELRYRVKDLTDWYPFCGSKQMTLSEGVTYVIGIDYCTSNSAATASIRNSRIAVFSLQSEYAESEGLSTTSSISWEDKATLQFTPPSLGDYLIIATANYRMSTTNRDTKIQLIQDDTIVHTSNLGRPGSGTTAEYYTFGVMRKVTLDAGLHSFKLQYCSSGTPGIAGINYAHIIAVRLDQFDSNYYAESEGESSPPASGVWYDKVVNSYTADSGDYLIFGSISYMSGSTSNSVGLNFQTELTTRQSSLVEHQASTNYESAFFMTKQTLSDGNKTDKIAWMGENTNARVRNARLISCKLSSLKQTAEVEFGGDSNVQNWTALEWTADSSFITADVSATFQLYNYQTGAYPASGDGYMSDMIGESDVTKNQTITVDPTYFRDGNGNWKIKITAIKDTDAPFELRLDWVEFKPTASEIYRLSINNSFAIDLSAYPLAYVHGFEIVMKYNVTEDAEKRFLKAYNWASSNFSDLGFNNTGGSQPISDQWNEYAIAVSDNWRDYVDDDGTLRIEFFDEGLNSSQAIVEIDFFAVRAIVDGVCLDLTNSGPLTTRVVAIWILNFTSHQRYDASLFINSGEEATYIRADISLPEEGFIVRVLTERGNVVVFQEA